jgi:hypothetical protein
MIQISRTFSELIITHVSLLLLFLPIWKPSFVFIFTIIFSWVPQSQKMPTFNIYSWSCLLSIINTCSNITINYQSAEAKKKRKGGGVERLTTPEFFIPALHRLVIPIICYPISMDKHCESASYIIIPTPLVFLFVCFFVVQGLHLEPLHLPFLC